MRFQKIKKNNLNDPNIISMSIFATCKIKMEQIILFLRNCESAFVFLGLQSSHGRETSIFVVERCL